MSEVQGFTLVENYLFGDWYIDFAYGLKRIVKYEMALHNAQMNNGSPLPIFEKIKDLTKPQVSFIDLQTGLLEVGEKSDAVIEEIRFSGTMFSEDSLSQTGIDATIDEFTKAFSDEDVKGILFSI